MNYFYEFSNIYHVKVRADERCEPGALGYVADFRYSCPDPEFVFDPEDKEILLVRSDFAEFLQEYNQEIVLRPIALRGRNLKISHSYLKAEISTPIHLDILNTPSHLMLDQIPNMESICFNLLMPMILQDDPNVVLGRRRESTERFHPMYLMREDMLERMFEKFETLRDTRHLWEFQGYMKMGDDFSWFPRGKV